MMRFSASNLNLHATNRDCYNKSSYEDRVATLISPVPYQPRGDSSVQIDLLLQ